MKLNSSIPAVTAAATLSLFVCLGSGLTAVNAATAESAARYRVNTVRFRVSEEMLALNVRASLLDRIREDALSIHVEATGQAITLTGEVKERGTVDLAQNVARAVNGVKLVNNKLSSPHGGNLPVAVAFVTLNPRNAVVDALLETRIKRQLLSKYGERAMNIQVEAYDGSVTLTGSTPDVSMRDRATWLAREARGAREVHDLMTISPKAAND